MRPTVDEIRARLAAAFPDARIGWASQGKEAEVQSNLYLKDIWKRLSSASLSSLSVNRP